MTPAILTENDDVSGHFNQSSPHEWSMPAYNKFPLKKTPEPLRIDLIPPYENSSDQAELEAQTPTAHKPTLKGVGKSDCEVKIVSVSECENEIPPEAFADKNSSWTSDAMQDIFINARTLTPTNGDSYSVLGSRAAQARKALRRPFLARRGNSSAPRLARLPTRSTGPSKYVSGATIRRLTSDNWAVRKQAFTGGKQDGSRLLKQIQKQLIFSATCRTSHMNATISTPEIYGLKVPRAGEESNIVVDMEYIPFHDVAFIILEQDKAVNEWLINAAISVVDYELTNSSSVPLKEVMPEFHTKADSIKKVLQKSPLLAEEEIKRTSEQIDALLQHYDRLPELRIPVGTCHGDLTLQNMLVDPINRELCVFDFLDCFVESPLQDLAKLLQDVRHQWFFTQVEIPDGKEARAVATLAFFYDKIRSDYEFYEFWEALALFEFMCLARILPYMTNDREKHCILHGLQRIDEDLKSSSFQNTLSVESSSDSYDSEPESPQPKPNDKTTVIVPALGSDLAQVYCDGQIKLMTVNPNGRPLIVDCVSSLSTDKVSRIIIAVPKPLIVQHCDSLPAFEKLFDTLGTDKSSKLEFFYSEQKTRDVIDTVTAVLHKHNVSGSIFIKDANNNFAHSVDAGNYTAFLSIVKEENPIRSSNPRSHNRSYSKGDLRPLQKRDLRPDLIDATKKSYVSFSYDNIVSNISHASFVSSQFCCGGYGFLSASDFLASAQRLRTALQAADMDLGLSSSSSSSSSSSAAGDKNGGGGGLKIIDVIWQMICEGHLFFGAKVSEYDDWGSLAAWTAYKATFTTHWVDMAHLERVLDRPDAEAALRDVLDNNPRRSIIFYTSKGEAHVRVVRGLVEKVGGGEATGKRMQMLHSIVSPNLMGVESDLRDLGL